MLLKTGNMTIFLVDGTPMQSCSLLTKLTKVLYSFKYLLATKLDFKKSKNIFDSKELFIPNSQLDIICSFYIAKFYLVRVSKIIYLFIVQVSLLSVNRYAIC